MTLSTIIDRISERILGSPLATTVARELTEERLAQRQDWAKELAALDDAELLAIRETHEPAKAQALADVKRCEAALSDACARYASIHRAAQAASFVADAARGRLQKALADSASPRLAACELDLRAEAHALYAQRDQVIVKTIDGNHREIWSNTASIGRRATALHAAIATVQALAVEALDEAALETRLVDLRAQLPALDVRPAKYHAATPDRNG